MHSLASLSLLKKKEILIASVKKIHGRKTLSSAKCELAAAAKKRSHNDWIFAVMQQLEGTFIDFNLRITTL